MENLTNDTPPKKGFWTPLVRYRFPPPSRVSALFFLYRNPRQSRPEALLEGSKNFRESAFSGTFSTPHTFCTPPYHGPNTREKPSPQNEASAETAPKTNPKAAGNPSQTPPDPPNTTVEATAQVLTAPVSGKPLSLVSHVGFPWFRELVS